MCNRRYGQDGAAETGLLGSHLAPFRLLSFSPCTALAFANMPTLAGLTPSVSVPTGASVDYRSRSQARLVSARLAEGGVVSIRRTLFPLAPRRPLAGNRGDVSWREASINIALWDAGLRVLHEASRSFQAR